MRRLDLVYLLTYIFYVKKLFKCQSLKREGAKKALLWKLIWLEKGGAKCIQNVWCQSQRLIPQRNIKIFHGIVAQKLSCFDQKVWKMEAKWKAFNQCKYFGEGSYMFISTSEIGHLTLCYLCMTWLNWSLKLHATLWTNSYLILTHNTQV